MFSWCKPSGFIYCHRQLDGWNMFVKQFPSSKTEKQSFQMNILSITWNWLKSNGLISEPAQGLSEKLRCGERLHVVFVVVTEVKTLKSDDLAWLRDKSGLAAGHGCVHLGNPESTDDVPGSFPQRLQSLPVLVQVNSKLWCLLSEFVSPCSFVKV